MTVYFVNACLRSSFLKSYDLQYLKANEYSPLLFASDLYRVGSLRVLGTLPPSYPDRGKLIFVTALFGSHLFGLICCGHEIGKKSQKETRQSRLGEVFYDSRDNFLLALCSFFNSRRFQENFEDYLTSDEIGV